MTLAKIPANVIQQSWKQRARFGDFADLAVVVHQDININRFIPTKCQCLGHSWMSTTNQHPTPLKTTSNMAMKHPPFEDVFPVEHADGRKFQVRGVTSWLLFTSWPPIHATTFGAGKIRNFTEEPIDRQEFADANWPQLRGEKWGGMMDAFFGGHGPKVWPARNGENITKPSHWRIYGCF